MTRPARSHARGLVLAAALVAATLAATLAQALTLDVDPSGGPLVLEDRVDAALQAWRDAGLEVETIDRRVRVRYAPASLMGPDVPVLVTATEDPEFDIDLLVHPELFEAFPGALVYALGVTMGGAPGEGALDPRQVAGAAPAPTAEDVDAVAAARAADPADLNRDGVVDFEDLLLLAERFGERGVNLPGDLDGDGVIDEADLEVLRERYTFTPLSTSPPGPDAAPPAPGVLPEVPAAPLDPANGPEIDLQDEDEGVPPDENDGEEDEPDEDDGGDEDESG